MKAAPPSSKVLRIAVVTDGLVCDEVHQSHPKAVSFGSDYRNDVVLFGGVAPLRHTMFDYRQGRYFLDIPAGVKGKLSLGSKTVTVSALRQQQGGERCRVVLDPRSKGKLLIGETTILFQFAQPKPVPPRLPFPVEYSVKLRDIMSPLEAYTMASSAAVLGSFFVVQAYTERKDEINLDEIDNRFVTAMGIVKEEKKEPEVVEEEKEDLLEDKEEEEIVEKVKPEEKKIKVLDEKPEKFSAKAMSEARSVGVARVLGTYGGPGEGTVFDVINSTENNLGELFAQGMTTTVLADGGDISPFVPGGTGITATGSAVQTAGFEAGGGPALDKREDKLERKIAGVTKATNTDVFGDVDKTSIKAAIKHRTSALQHCYNKALRTQPDLAGKMTFTIAISVMGSVTKVDVEEDTVGSPAVASCARAKMQGWRFPMDGAEEGAEVTFSVVFSGGG